MSFLYKIGTNLSVPLFLYDTGYTGWTGTVSEVSVDIVTNGGAVYQIASPTLTAAGPPGVYTLTVDVSDLFFIVDDALYLLRVLPKSAGAFVPVMLHFQASSVSLSSAKTALETKIITETGEIDSALAAVASDVAKLVLLGEANFEKTITYDTNNAPNKITIRYVLNDAAPDFSVADRIDEITVLRDSDGKVTTVTRKQVA